MLLVCIPPVFVTVSSYKHTRRKTPVHSDVHAAKARQAYTCCFVVSACQCPGSTLLNMSGSLQPQPLFESPAIIKSCVCPWRCIFRWWKKRGKEERRVILVAEPVQLCARCFLLLATLLFPSSQTTRENCSVCSTALSNVCHANTHPPLWHAHYSSGSTALWFVIHEWEHQCEERK